MIDLVAQKVVGNKCYSPVFDSVEEQAETYISTYNMRTMLSRINTVGTSTMCTKEYALEYSRLQYILSDPIQSAFLTDRCIELLLMNSLQEIL